jgi:hypothetical protein
VKRLTVRERIAAQASYRAADARYRILEELRRHDVPIEVAEPLADRAGQLVLARRLELGEAGLGRMVVDDPRGG